MMLSLDYTFNSGTGPNVCQSLETVEDNDFEGEEIFSGDVDSTSSLVTLTTDTVSISIFDANGENEKKSL